MPPPLPLLENRDAFLFIYFCRVVTLVCVRALISFFKNAYTKNGNTQYTQYVCTVVGSMTF